MDEILYSVQFGKYYLYVIIKYVDIKKKKKKHFNDKVNEIKIDKI